jgi:hypothetical protein
MGYLRRFFVKRPTLKPRDGTVVWTLNRGFDAAAVPLPPLKTQGEVQYLTGGVGRAAFESFRQARPKFPLAVEFVRKAAEHDTYIMDVDVEVTDPQGRRVLAVRTDGPYLLAKLPGGQYSVRATYFGHVLEKAVRIVDNASARVLFVWTMKL